LVSRGKQARSARVFIADGHVGTPRDRLPATHRLLEVYVAAGCWGCETAHRLVATVRALALPGIEARVVDLGAGGVVKPPTVTVVPTYLLDGHVLFRGNPEEAELVERLQSAAAIR